jgi:class 3 adenylate cyclase
VPRLEAGSVERKLAAIFAADVEGYSRLMGQDEVGTLRTLTAYRVIIDRLIASHRGRIFNTAGDSLVADFASAVDAVQCAVAVQDAIAKENADRPADEQIWFRIGIHVGVIIVQGENLFGDAVNVAARLEAIAEAGAICVSGVVRDHVGTKLRLVFADLGEQQVKNIAQPIPAYHVRGETSPTAAPVVDSRRHLRLQRTRHAGAGLCRDDPQEPGLRIPRRRDSRVDPALRDAAAQPALYRRHPREAPRRPGRPEEGRRHCRAQRLRPTAVVETERMVGSNCDAPAAKVGDGLTMVVSDSDIHRAARLHLGRHGDEAVAKARDMVRNLKEGGDNEAADAWLRIIVAIQVLQRASAT